MTKYYSLEPECPGSLGSDTEIEPNEAHLNLNFSIFTWQEDLSFFLEPNALKPVTSLVVSAEVAMTRSNSDFQLRERLKQEFGQEQSEQILELFCSGVGLELTKLKESSSAENLPRLLHNSRGLRAVCQSVFVSDMEQTCLEIEAAGERLDWQLVDSLGGRLQEQFASVCRQCQ